MFAVAVMAIAAISFGFTPAFAAGGVASVSWTAGSGLTHSGHDWTGCGSGSCEAKATSHTTQNWINYSFGTSGNNCDITTYISGGGAPYEEDHGSVNGHVENLINRDIDQSDPLNITNVYSNCT